MKPIYQLLIWSIVIAFATLTPLPEGPEIETIHLDKAAHFVLFYIFSFFAFRAWPYTSWKNYFFIVLMAVVYGVSIEFIQPFLGREFDYLDMIADTLGASMLILFIHFRARRAEKARK
jgi:VanZ family protein